ncbi:DUF1707 domain-containing protein [Amycolatopsis sp. PS_44_ISF1]|uniref:DUF1707 SHOCT-like domain-containing protein n=1 Tax=Amycolatopsis sp. PS_44_ISF1 TaxID=2974917 RepID=UPI0028DDE309|nr:DUF1707 domain-containing protein [Amycolatopsis sp. PS_44_ISF1]MDT8910479.1 DUF1707 domain-containing protein [Amycolatopsis sp. PS_44_ISF1]
MGEEETTTADTATETKPLTARDIRVSDDERDHVVGVLQKAIGLGLLDLDEFTERTDRALASRTRGELNAVLADLPGLTHPESGPPPYAAEHTRYHAPGQRLELNAKYSSLHRRGPWEVPAALLVRNKYGSTKLDFTEARTSTPVIEIELDSKWGSVEIVIPPHASVDCNSITEIKFGSLEDKTGSNGRAGNPRYVITGHVHGGALVIRNPRRGLFG